MEEEPLCPISCGFACSPTPPPQIITEVSMFCWDVLNPGMVENGVDPTTYHHARTQKTFQKDICNKGHVQRLKDNVWELVLPPCRAWGSNSGHQPWRQVPFPTELPHQPSTEAAQVFLSHRCSLRSVSSALQHTPPPKHQPQAHTVTLAASPHACDLQPDTDGCAVSKKS